MSRKENIITIVGRRNVGKSTLFNSLIRSRLAIVDDHPGLTRDVLKYHLEHDGVSAMLSDTPGLDLPEGEELSTAILERATEHLRSSAVIVLLLENPALQSYDHELLEICRRFNVPLIVAVNKMDSDKDLQNMPEFFELGFSDLLPISAKTGKNLDLLRDKIFAQLPQSAINKQEPSIKIALIGKPNSGKSTLLNAFLGYERSVVSDIPGTTRDSIDECIKFENHLIQLTDTAGIRKKSKKASGVEFFSLRRSIQSIEKSDVVIHLVDAEGGFSETDKKIADEINRAKKPFIIALNKWDKIPKDHKTFEEHRDRLLFKFYKAADAPVISISALEKQRIHRLMETALKVYNDAGVTIETAALNRVLEGLQKSGRLPKYGQSMKIYYATQIGTRPPLIRFYVNNPELFKIDVIRFFEKELQKHLQISGVPVNIVIEGKKKKPAQ